MTVSRTYLTMPLHRCKFYTFFFTGTKNLSFYYFLFFGKKEKNRNSAFYHLFINVIFFPSHNIKVSNDINNLLYWKKYKKNACGWPNYQSFA